MNQLEWISIKDRLPLTSETVLVTDGIQVTTANYFGKHTEDTAKDYHVEVGTPYWANRQWCLWPSGGWIKLDSDITHWLPLWVLSSTAPDKANQEGVVQIQIGGNGNKQSID